MFKKIWSLFDLVIILFFGLNIIGSAVGIIYNNNLLWFFSMGNLGLWIIAIFKNNEKEKERRA